MFRPSTRPFLRSSLLFPRVFARVYTFLPSKLASIHTFPANASKLTTASAPRSSPTLIEYEWIEGVESLEEYVPGGYHPVQIGDILNNRYEVVDKLGHGGYSTIWLAHDCHRKSYVAVKIGISDPSLPQSDVSTLSKLSHESIPKILDRFEITGPNGTHPCYTMALAQGTLNDALDKPMFSTAVGRVLAARLVLAVAYVHSQGYVHGDLHIRNMLGKNTSSLDDLSIHQFREQFGNPRREPIVRSDGQPLTQSTPSHAILPLNFSKAARHYTPSDAHDFVLSDFGEAFSPSSSQHLGRDSHTLLSSRPPEAFFEPDTPLSFPSDIWTMGTAIWEVLGMKFPFSQHVGADELIAEHIDVLGYEGFPVEWREAWERRTEDETNVPRKPERDAEDEWPPLEQAWEEFNQKYRRKREATGVFGEEESRAILEMMRGMWRFRPEERTTAREILGGEWMVRWALPELEKKKYKLE